MIDSRFHLQFLGSKIASMRKLLATHHRLRIRLKRGHPMSQSYEELDENYVLTLEEITNLTEGGGKPADTLMNVVALIATRFKVDVCSAYLLEPDRSNLVLAATIGLRTECVGTIRMGV